MLAASVRAIVADVEGKVIVVESVPAKVSVLFAVKVLPSAIVKVDPVAGVVRVTLLMVVALATPKTGVTKVGEVFITKVVPVPVCAATEVALPTDVIGPVKFALVVTFPAVKPAAVPVMFVPTNADGVPKAGVINVGEVENTRLVLVVPVVPVAALR